MTGEKDAESPGEHTQGERPGRAAVAAPPAEPHDRREPLPDHIGPYRILQSLGRGGMGVVYLAEQTAPVRRRVALKIIQTALRDRETRLRFESERQAMARLSHPCS